jgi:hypothetical protein
MEGLGFVFISASIIVGSFLAWTYTKAGKRWMHPSDYKDEDEKE